MASTSKRRKGDPVRCPRCFRRLPVPHDDDIDWMVELHRLSGRCRDNPPPKEEKSKKDSRKPKFMDFNEDYRF